MKHDTSLPAQPRPFLLVFVVLLCSIFLHYISHIFSSWNSNCLGPCVVFLTHKNTKKSHIIKTHNHCESIKRELKQKKRKFLKFVGKCTVHQCFYFTTRWWVHRVPSSIECVVDWTFPRPKCNQTKFTKYTLHRPVSSSRATKMGEHKLKKKKKKFYRKKYSILPCGILFSCRPLATVI